MAQKATFDLKRLIRLKGTLSSNNMGLKKAHKAEKRALSTLLKFKSYHRGSQGLNERGSKVRGLEAEMSSLGLKGVCWS